MHYNVFLAFCETVFLRYRIRFLKFLFPLIVSLVFLLSSTLLLRQLIVNARKIIKLEK